MSEAAQTRRDVNSWALWFGLFGGLTAWILHLAVGFVLVFDGCAIGLSYLRIMLGAVTLVFAVLAAAATIAAYRIWQADDGRGDGGSEARPGRIRFMALTGVWLSALACLIIVLLAIPVVWLNPCM
jgi:hypothetical protein